MKKRFNRKTLITLLLVLAAAAAAVGVGLKYRATADFHPFDPDRELNNNQILFPDGNGGTGLSKDAEDSKSFWEKDPEETGDSITPRTRPPTIAPRLLPIPPRMTTTTAESRGFMPITGLISRRLPIRVPAREAKAQAKKKATWLTRLMLMPINCAAARS